MNVTPLAVPDVLLITPQIHHDDRGFLFESFNATTFAAAGITTTFVQDNHSRSRHATLRGLHYQAGAGQAKLVRVTRGRIWDVAVDLRPGATFGRWVAHVLDDTDHHQLFIPRGFAHGFVVLSDLADVVYKLDAPYDPTLERGLAWDDPTLAITWPIASPHLSNRDRNNPALASVST